jgi:hypothetical protein
MANAGSRSIVWTPARLSTVARRGYPAGHQAASSTTVASLYLDLNRCQGYARVASCRCERDLAMARDTTPTPRR